MSLPEIFLVTLPGLEPFLAEEAREKAFDVTGTVPGGVTLAGGWPEVWRANLCLRGATRVLVRLASFRAMHLAQLDKRARKLPWSDWLRPDRPLRVEATSRKSRIYHAGAAAQRIERAVTETLGAPVSKEAALVLKLRIEDDLATLSVDTSGASLHKRELKQAVAKAPMRETMASLFLRAAGFDGREPVLDPLCGSGTFPIEAAEIASGLAPGRARAFAFETLASFDPESWDAMRKSHAKAPPEGPHRFFGSDRDQGAVHMAGENAMRAGVSEIVRFQRGDVSEALPPEGPPGLVIANPPYGGRIGAKGPLFALYANFGNAMKDRFRGWRVALVTSEPGLAKTTGLPFTEPGPAIDHGGIRVRLYRTDPL